jgi:hypothetical protein
VVKLTFESIQKKSKKIVHIAPKACHYERSRGTLHQVFMYHDRGAKFMGQRNAIPTSA